ncbi:MAG: amidohydrolase family protein [Candidatus Hadarchaeum sp.]|uniref:amidohydrolase family protein n=1 Tax=Candidatus Hadarchaeum sp. TaxID=2883567 RepID=UPI003173532B
MKEEVDLLIKNARLINREKVTDIAIKDEKIIVVGEEINLPAKLKLDVAGKLTIPGFIDSHMHLDHACLGGDAKWISRTHEESEKIIRKERQSIDSEGVKEVARKAALTLLKKSTTAVRTHVNVDASFGLRELKSMLEFKNECVDWMDLQLVAFPSREPLTRSSESESLLKQAMKLGADVVGGLPNIDPDPEGYLDIIFDVAKRHKAKIDLHVDETNDPKSKVLELYAEKTLENGYGGMVVASHCSALSAYSWENARRVIEKVREAEMSIIANPFTNIYILGRDGKPNGITRVKDLLDSGVNVTYATDNFNDAYNPLGNGDMLLAALFLAYHQRLEGKRAFSTLLEMGTTVAAETTGIIKNYGIKESGRADLVILEAETPWEAIVFQPRRCFVIKRGKIVVKNGENVKSPL